MSGSGYTSLEDVQAWARAKMQSLPDFIIGPPDAPYLRRWWVVPRNRQSNVYLHEILKSDDDRALHDHPWANTSFLIEGSYTEITPEGEFVREAGSIVTREAAQAHRLVVADGARVISLFTTGPTIREWGFHCPRGWRHWKDFVDSRDSGQIGRGCDQ